MIENNEESRTRVSRKKHDQVNGVDDGDRTHDHRSHNPGLYH